MGNIKKTFILCIILITCSSCSQFTLLASGASVAASQNSLVKMYNAADFGVALTTKKGIKQHVYEKGKKYIYDNTVGLFGNKH
jgi:hypothetical protein